jgi:hypothetical protein
MANSVRPTHVTQEDLTFFKDLRSRIEKKVKKKEFASKECWKWLGCTRRPDGKYGRVTFTHRGVKQTVGAHRASYIAYEETFDLPHDISHLCHMGLCVNPKHLSHEDRVVNLSRVECAKEGQHGRCDGHKFKGKVYKPCIVVKGE